MGHLNELDKILDCEMRPSTVNDSDASELGSNQVMMKHYLVKWKGRSYLHCLWLVFYSDRSLFFSNSKLYKSHNVSYSIAAPLAAFAVSYLEEAM